MTITFFSNNLNDHQLPFCLKMAELAGEGNFRFVAYEPVQAQRALYGFANMNDRYPFVVKSYESEAALREAERLMMESDVVISSSERDVHPDERIAEGKLTFRYNERIFKQRRHWIDPRVLKTVYNRWVRFKDKNLYTLCASSYLADELSVCGYPKERCLKWGYFPKVVRYDSEPEGPMTLKDDGVPVILWAGRMMKLKHPEVAVYIAARLKRDGYRFKLRMGGEGEKESELRKMIAEEGLGDCVELIGLLNPEGVRREMEKASVFLFTSNRMEGWGAVVNEAMNSGCAVVSSRSAGSSRFMIKHGENGFIYRRPAEAYQYVKYLLDNPQACRSMGLNAYRSILEVWNPEVAAERLFKLMSELLNNPGARSEYREGPVSPV